MAWAICASDGHYYYLSLVMYHKLHHFYRPVEGFVIDLLAQTAFTTQSPPAAVSRLTSQSLLHPGGNYYALVIHRERSRMTYAARSVYEQPRQARFEKLFHVAVGLALDLNFFRRILDFSSASPLQPTFSLSTFHLDTTYVGANESWSHERADSYPQVFTRNHPSSSRSLPVAPFRVLDAPNLRNDFYCSTLAYSQSFQTLAKRATREFLQLDDQIAQSLSCRSRRRRHASKYSNPMRSLA
ncbi:uncharacterized protein UV8b_00464 [Ustilaginoidea virens]|uniref:Uncharacterized protein n=1 Tax=Ustilaginoidea virens TaxID=1159556 RepID=A0A8E5HJ18_USTVR|nr:uncharacterized protein UV8b_00464 [Ustilaginoidea virens]QUC16223.1 hypothetical protein UV8b_00464 [Ustilaginoidea virens]